MADLILRDTDADELTDRIATSVIEQLRPLITDAGHSRLVDRRTMAGLLGVSLATFDRLRSTNDIPTRWIETTPRFDPTAVIEALPPISPAERYRTAVEAK
ncbi:hypothetical protein FYK55_05315 [Roseiconus nitratireducens]|uniref:Uncharacterized protein n=2 Tax=Roseiconus nitratireducens TaxID=2605748 RepID=A0A5M6DCJ8_9BACT|nr:hypothetical protein FYK55_05315 [Roseiconus nitratireducens]